MPRSSLETFDAAVKHLFRHLSDWKALQSNPIAQDFFAALNPEGSADGGRRALACLHTSIRAILDELRHETGPAWGRKRALLRLEIVRLQYFEGRSIHDIAKLLSLSVQHCYRERAQACRQIALQLSRVERSGAVITSSDDAFYTVLFNVIESRQQAPTDTLRALEYLHSIAVSPLHRMLTLDALIALALSMGQSTEAEIGFQRTSKLYPDYLSSVSPDLQAVAHTSHYIVRSSLANYRGDGDEVLAMATSAKNFADRMPFPSMPYVHKLYATAHFNWAIAVWNQGDLAEGYDDLRRVASQCERVSDYGVIYQRFQTTLWKARSYLVATRPNGYGLQARVEGLTVAVARARETNLPLEATEALTSILECHVFARQDQCALESARAAIVQVREACEATVQSQVAIDVAVRLLATKFWRHGMNLIPPPSCLANVNAYYRTLRNYALALSALRQGRFDEARRWSSGAEPAYRLNALEIRRLMVFAEASHGLGQSAVAGETAEAVVQGAERIGSAPLMSEAFTLATLVLGNKHFASRARELARILAA